ncbi:hypothetical protein VTG60DRAFT_875 [Thermothelomyces hinnuleus]
MSVDGLFACPGRGNESVSDWRKCWRRGRRNCHRTTHCNGERLRDGNKVVLLKWYKMYSVYQCLLGACRFGTRLSQGGWEKLTRPHHCVCDGSWAALSYLHYLEIVHSGKAESRGSFITPGPFTDPCSVSIPVRYSQYHVSLFSKLALLGCSKQCRVIFDPFVTGLSQTLR